MEMFLMILCICFFTLAIMAAALGASTRPEQPAPPAKVKQEVEVVVPATNFFTDYNVVPAMPRSQVPIEALLAQIENHIRLEQAAAESFLSAPSPAMLHNKTISRFVN